MSASAARTGLPGGARMTLRPAEGVARHSVPLLPLGRPTVVFAPLPPARSPTASTVKAPLLW